jgi:ATP-dependent DNA helicase RecG
MLPEKESLTVEFKSDRSKLSDSDIFDAVVAFANTEGGDLYLGIEDSGEVTGVHQAHKDITRLSAFIANNTIPPVPVRVEIIEDVYPVLKISVPKSSRNIVATVSGKVQHRRIKADGTPENVPMYPTEFVTRLSDARMLDYSAMPVYDSTIDDLDFLEIERLRSLVETYHGDKTLLDLSNEELCKALGMVREMDSRLVPTITGLLLIGKKAALQQHIPTHYATFQVMKGTDVKMNEDLYLPLLATIEKMIDYMNARNTESELEVDMFRVSVPEYDRRAYREALVNAFSHRDYTRMGRVRVALSDEGLTIANPGGFIEGVTFSNLLTVEPLGRNPQLAGALKRIGLAEKTGRGIDRIYEGSLAFGKPMPDYSASTTATVSLFIPRSEPDEQLIRLVTDEHKRLGHPLSLNTLLVLNVLRDQPRSNLSQLAESTRLSEIALKSILDKSVEYGIVESRGEGLKRTYRLVPRVRRPGEGRSGYYCQEEIGEERYPELIINMAKAKEFITRNDVVCLLHVGEDKAYRLLKALVAKRVLEPINKGKYSKYRYIRKR